MEHPEAGEEEAVISNLNTVCHRCMDKIDPLIHDRAACDEVLIQGLIKNQVILNRKLVNLEQAMNAVIKAIRDLDMAMQGKPKIHIVGQDPSNPVRRNEG